MIGVSMPGFDWDGKEPRLQEQTPQMHFSNKSEGGDLELPPDISFVQIPEESKENLRIRFQLKETVFNIIEPEIREALRSKTGLKQRLKNLLYDSSIEDGLQALSEIITFGLLGYPSHELMRNVNNKTALGLLPQASEIVRQNKDKIPAELKAATVFAEATTQASSPTSTISEQINNDFTQKPGNVAPFQPRNGGRQDDKTPRAAA
jgi:hypothetical protein